MRGLMLGGLAFVAVMVAERQFETFGSDIKRYNTMRAMSGDPPLARQVVTLLAAALVKLVKRRRPLIVQAVGAVQNDLLRYMRISTM